MAAPYRRDTTVWWEIVWRGCIFLGICILRLVFFSYICYRIKSSLSPIHELVALST